MKLPGQRGVDIGSQLAPAPDAIDGERVLGLAGLDGTPPELGHQLTGVTNLARLEDIGHSTRFDEVLIPHEVMTVDLGKRVGDDAFPSNHVLRSQHPAPPCIAPELAAL